MPKSRATQCSSPLFTDSRAADGPFDVYICACVCMIACIYAGPCVPLRRSAARSHVYGSAVRPPARPPVGPSVCLLAFLFFGRWADGPVGWSG